MLEKTNVQTLWPKTIKTLHCKQLSSAKQTSAVEILPTNSVKDVSSVLCVGYRAQRDFLQKKVFDCEGSLAEAKADRKESERDRKIHEAVTNLKRLFPGTYTPPLASIVSVAVLAFSLHLVIGIALNTLQTETQHDTGCPDAWLTRSLIACNHAEFISVHCAAWGKGEFYVTFAAYTTSTE